MNKAMTVQNSHSQQLAQLRAEMYKEGLTGYIISTTDEYLSEYAPNCAKRLEYITGFAGSNGLAIILESKTLFFTDGRYLTQAKMQLPENEFEIYNIKEVKEFRWQDHINTSNSTNGKHSNALDHVIGFDPKIFTKRVIDLLSPINPKPISRNLIDAIWQYRPSAPKSKIYDLSVQYCGKERSEKIADVRAFLKKKKLSATLITNPDSVCWLYNLRAHDIEFTPLLLAFAIVTEKQAYLFIAKDRIKDDIKAIRPDLEICDIALIEDYLDKISGKIAYDSSTCSYHYDLLMQKRQKASKAIAISDPIIRWKAIKNDIEIKRMQQGHIEDAVAVCEFLATIDQTPKSQLQELSEYDLGIMLTRLRKQQQNYVMDSFPAICGYQDNGAVIHYRADKQTAKLLSGSGLLLVDSGGHYHGATTDITRTIAIGTVHEKYKRYYTAVLKGHLQLAMIKFPANNSITGAHLDVLARQYLWSMGVDYEHGTGHGVGAFLGVHEGPHSISLAGFAAQVEAGMVMSDEPGYYQPGEFGIRIENVMYAKEIGANGSNKLNDKKFIGFEMLTLVPYCRNLIDINELSPDEIKYLIQLYDRIEQQVAPLLTNQASKWLKEEMNIFQY